LILVDANLLLYAAFPVYPQYDRVRDWLDERLNGPTPVGLPWASLLAFLRISTNPRAFERPLNISDAWTEIQNWLECGNTWIPAPTDRHVEVLRELLTLPGVRGDLISDAHLAALAIEHGLTLCSADTDFSKFPQLRWTNPVVG
jgi:uncharacterized protein